jgi:hypothetical protein
MSDPAVVEKIVRQRSFGTLSTVSRDGSPHSTGVVYAVAPPGDGMTLYVTTRRSTVKVQNILRHREVAFVIPVPRRLLFKFPPSAIQFVGSAEILDAEDDDALAAFRSSWFHRRILAAEERIVNEHAQMCFIAIRAGGTLFTYGIGMSPLHILRRPREAIGRVRLPG